MRAKLPSCSSRNFSARSQKIALFAGALISSRNFLTKRVRAPPHMAFSLSPLVTLSWTASKVFYAFTAVSTDKHAGLSLQLSSTETGPWLIPHIHFFVEVLLLAGRRPDS